RFARPFWPLSENPKLSWNTENPRDLRTSHEEDNSQFGRYSVSSIVHRGTGPFPSLILSARREALWPDVPFLCIRPSGLGPEMIHLLPRDKARPCQHNSLPGQWHL